MKPAAAIPPEDLMLAQSRGLRFEVTGRFKRGQQWELVEKDIESLERAFEVTTKSTYPEVAVWVMTKTGGKRYWGSHMPDLYNSLVLQPGYS